MFSVNDITEGCVVLLSSCYQGGLRLVATVKRNLPPLAFSLFHVFVPPTQIRGMSIDEAIAQLEFNDKKGAKIMKEV